MKTVVAAVIVECVHIAGESNFLWLVNLPRRQTIQKNKA